MKKLMFMLAAVLAVGIVQAAAVAWSTGRITPAGDGGSGWGTGNISGSDYTATIYFWSVAADAGDTSKALTKIGETALTGMSSSTIASKALKSQTNDIFTDGTYYTVLEVVDGSGNKLTSQVASFTIDNTSMAPDANLTFYTGSGFNETFSGTGGAFGAGGWTAAPEPTSGLLMLVGFGALALRRRRA